MNSLICGEHGPKFVGYAETPRVSLRWAFVDAALIGLVAAIVMVLL